MSLQMSSGSSSLDLEKETELTLGLPGTKTSGTKRGFSHTVDLHLTTSTSQYNSPNKEHVVGWPPVRASRKNAIIKNCKYVKVAVDGAPYLRKVDLDFYDGYDHLLTALQTMFGATNFTIRNNDLILNEYSSDQYMPTYEDKDGDWMLLGDVPWKMFVESCKRIRLMINSEEIDLGLRTTSRCTGSSELIN